MADDDIERTSGEGASLFPSIAEEFADLERELQRLTALPTGTEEQRNALALALRLMGDEWRKKTAARGEVPEWRRRFDDSVAQAIDGLLQDGVGPAPDGSNQFHADSALVVRHLQPVMAALTEGLKSNLVSKFAKRPDGPTAPPPKVDLVDVAGIFATLFTRPPSPKK